MSPNISAQELDNTEYLQIADNYFLLGKMNFNKKRLQY